MPFALLVAIAASIGLHVAALFGPDIDLSTEPEPLPLVVELKPLPSPQPSPQPVVETVAQPEKPAPVKAKTPPPRRKAKAAARVTPALSVPGPSSAADVAPASPAISEYLTPLPSPSPEPVAEVQAPEPAPVEPRLPPRGMISYRVDRGDSNFEIGVSHQEWEIIDGHYRLTSVLETTGLVWLFKAYRVEMESQGLVTSGGLRPETFAIRRNGQESKENARFDWENMKVLVGNRAEQALDLGAQDLLSFNYQLGFLPHSESGSTLPIATGRKYGIYRLEVLGDEEIVVPAGTLRTLHLRAPGVNTTELWLAYDYLLLPVKIRHVDAQGDSFVQVATQIQLSPP